VAVRIYTLSKELKIDSKELVDLCTRAGIQDKGSALASMSDEEVAKLKEFIAGKARPAERPVAAPAAGGASVMSKDTTSRPAAASASTTFRPTYPLPPVTRIAIPHLARSNCSSMLPARRAIIGR
jgi:translation initiation factor IF-2